MRSKFDRDYAFIATVIATLNRRQDDDSNSILNRRQDDDDDGDFEGAMSDASEEDVLLPG